MAGIIAILYTAPTQKVRICRRQLGSTFLVFASGRVYQHVPRSRHKNLRRFLDIFALFERSQYRRWMFKVKIIAVGRTKETWLEMGIAEYEKRLQGRLAVEWLLAKDDKSLFAYCRKEPL